MRAPNRLPLLMTLGTLAILSAAAILDYGFGRPILFPVAFAAAVGNTVFLFRRGSVPTDPTPARHRLRRRLPLWVTSLLVLAPASYVLGAPFILETVHVHFPAALPFVRVIYSPLHWYSTHPEVPGSELFSNYANGIARMIGG